MNKSNKSREQILREQNKSLKASLIISRTFSTVMTVAFCILGLAFMTEHNRSAISYDTLLAEYNVVASNLEVATEQLARNASVNEDLINISSTLDEQNKLLVEANESYYQELEEYRAREELYNKYEYALYDESGNRTDITYDQLETLEELVAESSIQDEDLILAWIMTESNGKEDATSNCSTAKGYGQFLNATSKFVYTDLLGQSDWNPNIAFDGATNMEMMVAYVDYLYERNNGDLYETIRDYRGREDVSGYIAKMDSYLVEKGKSIAVIASNT